MDKQSAYAVGGPLDGTCWWIKVRPGQVQEMLGRYLYRLEDGVFKPEEEG